MFEITKFYFILNKMESEINAVVEHVQEELPAATGNENYGNVVTEEANPGQDSHSN